MSESSDPRRPEQPDAPQPPGEQLYPARPVGSPPAPPPMPANPGYGQPSPYASRPTNGLAIASLVLGILWLGWVGSVLAVIFGHVAVNQIRQSEGFQQGRGLAIAGLILGWIGIATFVIFFLAPLVLGLIGLGAAAA